MALRAHQRFTIQREESTAKAATVYPGREPDEDKHGSGINFWLSRMTPSVKNHSLSGPTTENIFCVVLSRQCPTRFTFKTPEESRGYKFLPLDYDLRRKPNTKNNNVELNFSNFSKIGSTSDPTRYSDPRLRRSARSDIQRQSPACHSSKGGTAS